MEPVSIFTTIAGILTFFRNNFRSLQQDAVEWKHYEDWNEDRKRRLIELRRHIEDWQKRWMIWTEDDELWTKFWGEEKDTIKDDLKSLRRRVERFDEILKDKRKRTKVYRTFVVNKGAQLDSALNKIEDRFKTLSGTSNRAFANQPDRETDSNLSDDPSTLRIHKIGLQKLLLDIAEKTYKVTDQLHRCALRAHVQQLAMELEMNMFCPDLKAADKWISEEEDQLPDTHFATRSQGIAISAKDKAIHYTFLVKRSPEALWLRIRTTQTPDARTFHDHLVYQDFEPLVKFITNGHLNTRCGLYLSNNIGVVVRREVGGIDHDVPESRPLRDVLTSDPPNNHEAFERIKARRAFQLAEFGFLFLGTTWMQSICSCNIRQVEVDTTFKNGVARVDERYRLTLRLLAENAPYVAGVGLRSPSCWCNGKNGAQPNCSDLSPFKDNLLFFLGLVLIEVVLSAPLSRITINKPDPLMETVTVAYPFQTGERTSTLSALKESISSNGDAFYNAIQFCIHNRWRTGNEREENLKEYYRSVLYPLYTVYTELVNNYLDYL
ncbi:hypothetical protein DER44DRAFT_59484 [Fusarium oxysporum]|nr:hypothetical protein DER44DRAFT_59484 [Fusarium oxysporum]